MGRAQARMAFLLQKSSRIVRLTSFWKSAHLALINNKVPRQWLLSNIIPVPKSGDIGKTDNYRAISLTCIIAKMFNLPGKVFFSVLLAWLKVEVDSIIREEQSGYREERSCCEQTFTLRNIIEQCREHQT
ncbi:uncharacterized protein LOC119723183 [Patiria miniata]|uniref:Reverse transcriptase domain-containing protein n=1 Tax=Patiria miniata TaxID=46514 RepID=A0A913ZFC5_PATMI|nr:uncharacterized protein LOC119723183 [Patiria miniata]